MSANLLPLVMAVYTGELGLTLPMLPWHSMVAARCQVLLTLAQRHQLRCVFDPSSPEELSLPSQGPGQSMCALFLCDVCRSWTSGHSPTDFRFLDICSDFFTRPDLSWDSRRARHMSPPNEFDCHAPSSRGSFRSCITMYSTLACPRHTCRHHPCIHGARCLRRLGHKLSSCCLKAASVVGRTTSL